MAEAPELSSVTFADIADIESQLDDVDSAVTAFQHLLSQRALKKREALSAQIPHFWALVLEQAPPEVDQYIQPSDSAVLAACLTGIHVDRFETKPSADIFSKLASASSNDAPLDVSALGEPRSFSLRFEFAENDWFSDKVIEKKFWFRRARDGWSGRVSDPVKINWKGDKDLTDGLNDAAVALWSAQKKAGFLKGDGSPEANKKEEQAKELPEFKALADKVENSMEGSQSFFTFFGFRGRWVSDQEHKIATKEHLEKLAKPASERANAEDEKEDEEIDDEDLGLNEAAAEIFFEGEEIALAIAEDIWPNATKYFLEAQDDDDDELSEGDFDEDELDAMDADDDDADGDDAMEDAPQLTKRKGRKSGEDLPPKKQKS